MKKIQTKKSGFTLIESMIAIFIFSLAAAMLSGAFSGFFKTYVDAKKTQRNTESSQFAMNVMAKTIRGSIVSTNFVDNSSVDNILVFDNSRSTCVVYKYIGGVLKSASSNGTDIASCVATPPNSFFDLTGAGEITSLSFYGKKSTSGLPGKVTISMGVDGGVAAQMQTSVSLRQ